MCPSTCIRNTVLGGALFAALCLAPLAAAKQAHKIELENLRQRIGTLQKNVASAESSRHEARDALKQSEQAISTVNRQLHQLSQQEESSRDKLKRLQDQAGQTRRNIALRQSLVGEMLARQYAGGNQDSLKIMLGQEDPNQAARQLHYYTYLYRAHADLIRQLRQDLGSLQDITHETQDQQQTLAKIKADQQAQKIALEKSKKDRRDVLQRLSSQIAQQRGEIKRLQRDEQRLTQLMERLSKAKPHKKPAAAAPRGAPPAEPDTSASAFRQYRGKLRAPVAGELIGHFGSPRDDTGILWKGLYFRAREGSPVYAVANGHVVFADWLRGFGNLIIVDHGDGFMSLYGNNETLYKEVGATVKSGDTIAAVGNSGGNPKSGLYFELRYQSKPVNPERWLTKK